MVNNDLGTGGAYMKICQKIKCINFPCLDIRKELYQVPSKQIQPDKIRMVMISEAAPGKMEDYYYSGGESLFEKTTLLAFQDAGVSVKSYKDILSLGVYFTTAIKCGKTGYGIKTDTIKECSSLLKEELSLFPNAKVWMLMGDVAIQAVNSIARRQGEKRVIPAGSTCKLRSGEYYYHGVRIFPSYLQAGPSFFIEKSKRTMIAQDIQQAMSLLK